MELHTDIHAGKGPYLLLVHGFLSSRAQFEPNLAALSEVTRPVVLELWGHGRSPVPEDRTLYHPDAYVDAFEGVRKRLGIERWMICGQSLGAALTLRYALEYPQRVSAQIFTNSTSAFADAAWADGLRQTAASNGKAIRAGGRAALEQMPFHPNHATRLPATARDALLKDSERLDPFGVARTVEYTVPESSVRDRIQNNEVPTLLVCGTRDKRFATYRAFAEDSMSAFELVCVDAGHAVNLEASEAFDKAAVSFIQRQTAS